jgi:riboflavin kinase/FMN adenylyltransferase
MRRLADERGLETAVFTFPNPPRMVLQADYQPKRLTTFDEKLQLLSETGIDYCVIMDFTPELAACPASRFIVHILSGQWGVKCLLTGYDHRFGHNRTDGFEQYVAYGRTCGMEVLPATAYETDNGVVSSSRIKQLLSTCSVEEASRLLSYPYRIKGWVVEGQRIGRTLGFPTANIEVDDPSKVWPGTGVYAVWVYVNDMRYKGMLTIGNRPTMKGGQTTIEVHLIDFSQMIYHQTIEVEFVYFLRDNKKFENLEALKTQLGIDQQQTAAILK